MDVDRIAREIDFSGVVRIDRDGEVFERAYGLAHRGYEVANTVDTRFAIASGAKGFTALAVVSLVEQGVLSLDTRVRELLGDDLPLIDDAVTVEHLLTHHSGIGDYLDEDVLDDITEYVLPVPVHRLLHAEQYLAVLDGFPQKFPPGQSFSYCNGGYVVLALIAERASGVPFHRLVVDRVCTPAGMADTDFLRSDTPLPRVATGHLKIDGEWRTNVLHLPVRGSGDGGIFTTAADVTALWRALFAGKIVSPGWVAEMVRPRSFDLPGSRRYGMGFWLDGASEIVRLEGYDAGVSFWTQYDPGTGEIRTVIGNTDDGAWPIARELQG